MITLLTLQQQSSIVHDLVAAHKCKSPRVFGSVAAGTNTAESDVDLLVDALPGATLLDIVHLEFALQQEFGVHFDVNISGTLRKPWRQSVLDGAIPL